MQLYLLNISQGFQVTLTVLAIILAVALLFFLIAFIGTYFKFKQSFGRRKKTATHTNKIYKPYIEMMVQGAKDFMALCPEEVCITSSDGLKLKGYFYRNPDHKGTVIFMHGYHGEPTNDFGPVLPHFKSLGYSLLLPDQRAHGKSEGKYLTFGVMESDDCKLWAEFVAKEYPNSPISLHGISMGGATVGMASCLNLPSEVKLIAIDCGFTSPDEIVSHVREQMHLPKFPFHYYIRFFARVFAKFSLTEKSTPECLAKTKLPTLFIHGEADDYVPYYMGKLSYEASNGIDKLMISVKNAGHGLAYITEPERVKKEFTEFYLKHMK